MTQIPLDHILNFSPAEALLQDTGLLAARTAAGDSFQELLRREFPEQAAHWANPLSRRQFFALMGASLALAGAPVRASDDGSQLRSPFRIDYVGYLQAGPKVALFLAARSAPGAGSTPPGGNGIGKR